MTPEVRNQTAAVADRRVLQLGKGNRRHHSSSGATVSSTCMPKIGDGPLRTSRMYLRGLFRIHARPLDIRFTAVPRISDFGRHQIQDAGDFMGRDEPYDINREFPLGGGPLCNLPQLVRGSGDRPLIAAGSLTRIINLPALKGPLQIPQPVDRHLADFSSSTLRTERAALHNPL